ncbi:cupin domain-containing protein [Nanoarchaeota archaeon]
MLIKKEQSKLIKNSEFCSVREYNFPYKELGIAIAEIDGRYPDEGKVVNEKCDEIYYVLSGSAIVHIEDKDFEINEGDALYIEKGKLYWVEANKLKIVAPTAPAWFFEQNKKIK